MQDISASVGMSGSSIYRHLPGKQALLQEALESALTKVTTAVTTQGTFDEVCVAVADAMVSRPDFWILLRREARHLDQPSRHEILGRAAATIEEAVHKLSADRDDLTSEQAELRARAALACLAAPSQYPRHTGPADEARQVAQLAALVAQSGTEIESLTIPAQEFATYAPAIEGTRRDQILAAARDLMSRHGYQSVSLNQIGAAAGIAGPSLYHHFTGKPDILASILQVAVDRMELYRRAALRGGGTDDMLAALARSYVTFAAANTEVFRIFVNDAIYLPDGEFSCIDTAHRRHVATWTVLAEILDSDDDPIDPQQRVSCALSIVNEFATTRPPRELAENAATVLGAVLLVLGLPVSSHALVTEGSRRELPSWPNSLPAANRFGPDPRPRASCERDALRT